MNITDKMIMQEYFEQRDDYLRLGDAASEMLSRAIEDDGIKILSISHRLKTDDSLANKIEAKDGKYHCLSDITDVLGIRIICYFADDIDRIASRVESLFEIDRANSVDKRLQMNPNAFGYLSVHYICSLRPDGAPEGLTGKKFEIQIRTILQHAWAEIEHDLGYKSEFGIPRPLRRDFFRVSGILELVDNEFMNIRDSINGYITDVKERIAGGTADDVPIDLPSLREYMMRNVQMRSFLDELAAICGAEICDISPESYVEQLAYLGKKTLGDLNAMLEKYREDALRLAGKALGAAELDILSSNVGLRYLCRAELMNGQYSEEQAEEFLMISLRNPQRAKQQAHDLISSARR